MDIKYRKEKIENFEEAMNFLNQFIPGSKKMSFPGEMGLERMRFLANELDNPQEKINVVHVAGTSGKGSTVFLIAGLLHNHDKKVGAHLSPFIEDFRERFMINEKLIEKHKFVEYLNEVKHSIISTADKFGFVPYFEILTGLAYYIFHKEKVDYAIIETGLGGMFDATNIIKNKDKVAVINKIGFDHMDVLGNTINQIAYQKSGIIQKDNFVLSIYQEKQAKDVIATYAKNQNTQVDWIEEENILDITSGENYTKFDYKKNDLSIDNVELNLKGSHQSENCSLAIRVLDYLSKRDNFDLSEKKIRDYLRKVTFKARFEIVKNNAQKIIVDGAHNPQKMQAFIDTLKEVFPDRKFNFMVSIKAGKDSKEIFEIIRPVCEKIFLTTFVLQKQDMVRVSEKLKDLEHSAKNAGITNIEVSDNPTSLLNNLKEKQEDFVITGSLYFIGSIYKEISA